MAEYRIEIKDGKALVYTPYNKDFVKRVKLIGGRWNAADSCWAVAEDSVDDVRRVMRDVYGRDDLPAADLVDVEITFTASMSSKDYEGITLLGHSIATARGRDTGARVGDDVMFLKGEPESAGSRNHWYTYIPEGCVVKVKNVPANLIPSAQLPEGVEMKVLDKKQPDRAALEAEKAQLLKRLAEIDAALSEMLKV